MSVVLARQRARAGRSTRTRWGAAARFGGVLLLALVIVFPIYTAFLSAFSLNGTLGRTGLIPDVHAFTFSNFGTATRSIALLPEYLVSVGVVALQTAAQLATGALAAYALAFPRWRGRALAFALVIVTLAVPGETIVIPNYETVSALGLRNTILGVALPYLAAGYPIFLLRQAFAGMPREIWEAARLDGCGDLGALVRIVMPVVRPQVTAAVVWSALSAWNGFFWPLLITDTATARTVQVGISQLAGEQTPPSVIFAGSVLVVLPTMALVIGAQRFLVNSLARGLSR